MQDTSIKSADRVLDVLELLCRRGNSATHSEIAFSLDIPKSSLTSLLRNLTNRGYLKKELSDMTYSLGPTFFSLADKGKQVKSILKIADNQVSWLTEKTHEATAFYLFKGDHVERVIGKEANYPLSYRMTPGVKFPLYSAAAGKAVLGALSEKEQKAYFEKTQIKPITKNTATSEQEIRRRLKTNRGDDGIVISNGENSEGVIALAIAILDEETNPIGAISVVIPEARFNKALDEKCRLSLKSAAKKIQHELVL
jgi:DNA-binding IclR family transcriptional regulator